MRRLCLILALVAGLPAAASGQQRSQVGELLRQASNALNDLRYGRADTIARGVLAFGDRISREERVEALQILVAALYPEERGAQKLEPARTFMKQLVRLDPEARFPRAISWPGIDSLLAQTRRATFSIVVKPLRDNAVTGSTAAAIPFLATRPARIRLVAVPDSGPAVTLDSVGPETAGALSARVLRGDVVVLRGGRYTLRVTAIDASAPDTIVVRFGATVIAPPLALAPVPPVIDSSVFRPEVLPPAKGRNIAIGVGLGAVTALVATAFRAEEPVKSVVGSDSRAYIVGAGLVAGGLIGAFMDKGAPQPDNVAWNSRQRDVFAQRVRDIQSQNDQKKAAYRATITIDPEAR